MIAVLEAYVLVGLLFAFWFTGRLVDELDDRAKGAGWGFRLLLIPGSVALWPYLLSRMRRRQGQA